MLITHFCCCYLLLDCYETDSIYKIEFKTYFIRDIFLFSGKLLYTAGCEGTRSAPAALHFVQRYSNRRYRTTAHKPWAIVASVMQCHFRNNRKKFIEKL